MDGNNTIKTHLIQGMRWLTSNEVENHNEWEREQWKIFLPKLNGDEDRNVILSPRLWPCSNFFPSPLHINYPIFKNYNKKEKFSPGI